jgi:hypothetical protein
LAIVPSIAFDIGNPATNTTQWNSASATNGVGTPLQGNVLSGSFLKFGGANGTNQAVFDLSGGVFRAASAANDTSKYSAPAIGNVGANYSSGSLVSLNDSIGDTTKGGGPDISFTKTATANIPDLGGSVTLSLAAMPADALGVRVYGGMNPANGAALTGLGLIVKISGAGLDSTCALANPSSVAKIAGFTTGIGSFSPTPIFSTLGTGGVGLDSNGQATETAIQWAKDANGNLLPQAYSVPAATPTPATGNLFGCGTQAQADAINNYFGLPYNASPSDASIRVQYVPNPIVPVTAVQTIASGSQPVSVGYPVSFSGAKNDSAANVSDPAQSSMSKATDAGTAATTPRTCNGRSASTTVCTTYRGIGLFSFDAGDGSSSTVVESSQTASVSDATHLADNEVAPGTQFWIAGVNPTANVTACSTGLALGAQPGYPHASQQVPDQWGHPATRTENSQSVSTVATTTCPGGQFTTTSVTYKRDTVAGVPDGTSPTTPGCAFASTPVTTTNPPSLCLVGSPYNAATSLYSNTFVNGVQPWQTGFNSYGQIWHSTYPVAPTVTHAYSAAGTYTAKLQVTDTDGDLSKKASNTVTVVDLPTANNASVTMNEDGAPKAIAVDAAGPPGHTALTYTNTQPAHGTVTGTGPNYSYQPAPDFNGADAFTYTVADDVLGGTATGTVTVNVAPVNDRPTIVGSTQSTSEDTAIDFSVNAADIDGDALGLSASSPDQGGSVTFSGLTAHYTPAQDFNGSETFTVTVNDQSGASNATASAPVTVNVGPVDDAPTVSAQLFNTKINEAIDFSVVANDVEGDALTYSIPGATTKGGTITPNGGNGFHYVPPADFYGNDSVDVTVRETADATKSAVQTLTLAVAAADPPVPDNQSLSTNEDTAKSITLTADDPDGAAHGFTVTYSIQNAPQHGTISGGGGDGSAISYTPDADYNGADFFTFTADDGHGGLGTGRVDLNVTPVNDAPVATAQSVATDEDTPLGVALGAVEVDGDTLAFSIVTGPAHGTLSGSGANQQYTPAANYNGADSFRFKADDGHGLSSTALVTIVVNAVNDAPVASNQTLSTNEDTPLLVNVASDVDGDTLSYSFTGPQHGTFTGSGNSRTFSPNANYFSPANAPDTIAVTVSDGTAPAVQSTITITVNPVNDAPIPAPQTISMTEDGAAKAIVLTATDVEGDPITFGNVSGPGHGTLTGTPATKNRSYKPDADFCGTDTFTISASDGKPTPPPGTAVITIVVACINDAPKAQAQSATLLENTSKALTVTGTDVDQGDVLTYAIVVPPAHGTLTNVSPDNRSMTYVPNTDYFGTDFFTFRVTDSGGLTASAQVKLSITHVRKETAIKATPAILKGTKLSGVSAKLTRKSNGLPLVKKSIKFTAGGLTICTAITNSSGIASCGGSANTVAFPIVAGSYKADFAGDADYLPSSTTAPITS